MKSLIALPKLHREAQDCKMTEQNCTSNKMFIWDDLKHFLAFAREGSMLAAAKAQGVNHSTVYRRLVELERHLGCKLVQRQLTGYRLTELGLGLLPHAEHVEEAVAACERFLASHDRTPTGMLRVTCNPVAGNRLGRTSLFETFHTRFPDLRVELVMSDKIFDLSKGEADIAIRSLTGRRIEDHTLVGRKIAEQTWAVYASRSYVERHGRPDCPKDIAFHSVVIGDGALADHGAARWLRSVAPAARVGARSESWSDLIFALKSGAGIAPLSIAAGEREGELVRVIDEIPELVTHFYLLVHKDMQRIPRIRVFIDFVESEIRAFRAALGGARPGNSESKLVHK
jgi:DNA-binding transcriptional LysR family regulator